MGLSWLAASHHATAMLNLPDRQQLDRALALVRGVLGGEVVGAYLFGSAVQGGLRPESDIDVFVVCRRPTTFGEKKRLADELMAMSGRGTPEGTWRRVEVTAVVQDDIKPWRYPPRLDFQYGDWLRAEFEKGNFEPLPPRYRPDLALLITMVLAADSTLVGPPPVAVFDTVPREDLVRAMASDLDRLRGALDQDTRNVILTVARMWATLATGAILPKDAAASWVVERMPAAHRSVLMHAREAYLGSEPEQWDHFNDAIASCVDYMIAEMKHMAAKQSVQP